MYTGMYMFYSKSLSWQTWPNLSYMNRYVLTNADIDIHNFFIEIVHYTQNTLGGCAQISKIGRKYKLSYC